MKMKNREAYIIMKGDSFVKIDHSTGGYPYYVDTLFHAEFFATPEKAFNYAQKFKDLTVKKVTFDISNYFTNEKE